MAATLRVGFVGLGSMGGPMVERMIDEGVPTTLWARRAASLEAFPGAATAASLVELGACSDYVGICVINDDDVRSVVLGDEGVLAGMTSGSVLVIHSTVHPDTCAELAAAATPKGIAVVDAPVSGGGPRAALGQLLVLLGGEAKDVETIRPVLSTFGSNLVHVGGLGAGQMAKIINNTLMTAHLGTAQAAADAAAALGLDPAALLEAMSHGSAASFSLDVLKGHGAKLSTFPAGALLRKDVDLFENLITAKGVDPGILGAVSEYALDIMGAPAHRD
jgi:3-hydroxyisobutyrate dehydrogenase-like beta-hydroxyacid dehydrogenase